VLGALSESGADGVEGGPARALKASNVLARINRECGYIDFGEKEELPAQLWGERVKRSSAEDDGAPAASSRRVGSALPQRAELSQVSEAQPR
jgi:hypothetical protein